MPAIHLAIATSLIVAYLIYLVIEFSTLRRPEPRKTLTAVRADR